MNHIPEAAAAGVVIVGSLTSWITEEDWNRLVGPWGGFVVSIILCALLLRHSAKRIRREDERAMLDSDERERRHQENLAAMRETHAKFETITGRQMECQLETAKALLKLSHSCETLHREIQSRPCQRFTKETEPFE